MLSWNFANFAGSKTKEMDKQIERIKEMEACLDRAREAVEALDGALQRYDDALPLLRRLDEYLGSDEWHAHREADAAGLLPPALKRGVLSEDGAWDVLVAARALRGRLLAAGRKRL